MEDIKHTTDGDKTDSAPAEQPQAGATPSTKMMLFFGGAMAVCCGLPLLLASGFSLAWITGYPVAALGIVAVAGLFAWNTARKKSACCTGTPSEIKPRATRKSSHTV